VVVGGLRFLMCSFHNLDNKLDRRIDAEKAEVEASEEGQRAEVKETRFEIRSLDNTLEPYSGRLYCSKPDCGKTGRCSHSWP